jgi:hypothetical protein
MNPTTPITNWEVVSSKLGKFRDEFQPKYENVKSSFSSVISSEYTYISLTKVKEITRSYLKN